MEYLGRRVHSVGVGFNPFNNALDVARDFESLLHDYRSIREKQPTSFDEEEQLNREKRELGERVRESVERLNKFISVSETEQAENVTRMTTKTPMSRVVEVQEQGADGTSDELEVDQESENRGTTEPPSDEAEASQEGQVEDPGMLEPVQGQANSEDPSSVEVSSASEQVDKIPPKDITEAISTNVDTDKVETVEEQSICSPSILSDLPRYGLGRSTELAKQYLAYPSLSNLETLMWSLIGDDDISGAYWISKYLEVEGCESSATPLLLKAVQGARWLPSDIDRFAEELFKIVADYGQTGRSNSQELLEFAASIHSSAVALHSQMLEWLNIPDYCPQLEPIVTQIYELPSKGISLRPEYVRGLVEVMSQNQGIASVSEDARKWIEAAPMKHANYPRANRVWKHLTDSGGELNEMLAAVKDDVRNDAGKIKEWLTKWNPDLAPEIINQVDRELEAEAGKVPKSAITGHARNWLLRGIEEARRIADRWCRLIEDENKVQSNLNDRYFVEQVSELRSQVQSTYQTAMDALSELSSDSHPIEIAASATCAKRSLQQLLDTLDIEPGNVKWESPIVPELESIVGNTENLEIAMARRLLWTDSVMIDDDGLPLSDSLHAVIHDLAASVQNENTLVQAIESRMDCQDYRFFDIVSNSIPYEMQDSTKTRWQKAIRDSKATLENFIVSVERGVRQAAKDGVIEVDDANWIDYISRINGIRSRESTLNFPSLTEELESIATALQELSESRYAGLCEEWELVLSSGHDADPNAISSWQEKFDLSKERRDIRVMEECLMRLRTGSIGTPRQDSDSIDGPEDYTRNSLSNFISFSEGFQDIESRTRSSAGLSALKSHLSALG